MKQTFPIGLAFMSICAFWQLYVVPLMSDLPPKPLRSGANAVINPMGTVGGMPLGYEARGEEIRPEIPGYRRLRWDR